jgi:DUF971 family protein
MADQQVAKPTPENITVHSASKVLEVSFSDGASFRIPFELLRVCSPSAEVQGHGPGQETLQTGKRHVDVVAIEPVGNYAVQPTFSDGHNTGLYTWEYLYFLGSQQDKLWEGYFAQLKAADADRDAPMAGKASSSCATH